MANSIINVIVLCFALVSVTEAFCDTDLQCKLGEEVCVKPFCYQLKWINDVCFRDEQCTRRTFDTGMKCIKNWCACPEGQAWDISSSRCVTKGKEWKPQIPSLRDILNGNTKKPNNQVS